MTLGVVDGVTVGELDGVAVVDWVKVGEVEANSTTIELCAGIDGTIDVDLSDYRDSINPSSIYAVTWFTNAGLTIDYLNEYDASPYNIFPELEINNDGMYELSDKLYPLLFDLKATKN